MGSGYRFDDSLHDYLPHLNAGPMTLLESFLPDHVTGLKILLLTLINKRPDQMTWVFHLQEAKSTLLHRIQVAGVLHPKPLYSQSSILDWFPKPNNILQIWQVISIYIPACQLFQDLVSHQTLQKGCIPVPKLWACGWRQGAFRPTSRLLDVIIWLLQAHACHLCLHHNNTIKVNINYTLRIWWLRPEQEQGSCFLKTWRSWAGCPLQDPGRDLIYPCPSTCYHKHAHLDPNIKFSTLG